MPIRSPPLPVENLRGWLSRLSDRNGLGGHNDILAALNLQATTAREKQVALLACLGGVPQGEIDWIVPRTPYHGAAWLGGLPGHELEAVPWILRRHPQVCPACLVEGRPLHAAWDLAAWTACPFHGCWMVGGCQRCGTPLRHRRRWTFRCSDPACRTDLRDAPRIPGSPLVVRLAALLAGKAGMVGLPAPVDVARPLETLGIAGLAYFVRTFARTNVGRPGDIAQRSEAYRTAAMAAADALFNWPVGFHSFLAGIYDGSTKTLNLDREFPRYHAMLKRHGFLTGESASMAQILVTELVRFSEERRLSDPERAGLVHGRAIGADAEVMSASEAAAALHMSASTVKQLLDGGELAGERRILGRKGFVQLSRDSVHAARDRWRRDAGVSDFKREAGVLAPKEAAAALGVAQRPTRELIARGVLDTVKRHRKTYVMRSSLENLLDAFSTKAKPAEPGMDLVLPWVVNRHRIPLPDVIAAVRGGDLIPVRIETQRLGLRRFLFERAEVACFAARVGVGPELTLREVRERLGCTWRDVRRLVELDLLKGRSVPWRNGADTLMVDGASVRVFEKTYASTKALAALSGTPGNGLSGWLRSRSVFPLVDADGRDLSAFWLRDDALKMLACRRA